jgi:hypothetical protein
MRMAEVGSILDLIALIVKCALHRGSKNSAS